MVIDNGNAYFWNGATLSAAFSITSLGTITPHTTNVIGRTAFNPALTGGVVFGFSSVVSWSRALSATELGDVSTYLLGNYT